MKRRTREDGEISERYHFQECGQFVSLGNDMYGGNTTGSWLVVSKLRDLRQVTIFPQKTILPTMRMRTETGPVGIIYGCEGDAWRSTVAVGACRASGTQRDTGIGRKRREMKEMMIICVGNGLYGKEPAKRIRGSAATAFGHVSCSSTTETKFGDFSVLYITPSWESILDPYFLIPLPSLPTPLHTLPQACRP